MAFTGQLMRWDQDAYWGLGIGASIAARTPFVGQSVVHLILGGPIIAGGTLSRVFTAHVFLVPGILIALVGLHLWLVLRLGVNEWPMPGRLVDRQTYRLRYMEEIHRDGVPFVPDVVRKDMVSMAVAVLLVLACAAIFGPFGPHGVPDPTIIDTAPKPDFYFLALFALFALLPPWTETVLLLIGPPLAIALLLAVPFLAGTGEKSWKRRPVAVLGVILIVLTVTTLAGLGVMVPWSPVMDAWSGLPTPVEYVHGSTALSQPAGPISGPESIVLAWNFDPIVVAPVLTAAALYIYGWARASRQMAGRFDRRHLCAFLTGLVAVGVALVSPLDSLGESLLLAHMGQHLLLMLVAPPLLWLGAPVAPLLLGLPRRLRRAVATGLALAPVRKLAESVRHPIVAWVSFSLAFWIWH